MALSGEVERVAVAQVTCRAQRAVLTEERFDLVMIGVGQVGPEEGCPEVGPKEEGARDTVETETATAEPEETAPAASDAKLLGLRVRHTELGKDGELAAGMVIEAMGLEASISREPTEAELQRMESLLDTAMDQGYMGMSTDGLPFHYLSNHKIRDRYHTNALPDKDLSEKTIWDVYGNIDASVFL